MNNIFQNQTTQESDVSFFTKQENNYQFFTTNVNSISFFDQSIAASSKNQWSIVKAEAFINTLNKRTIYLDTLTSLSENWINGKSEIPNIPSVNYGKAFLQKFKYFIESKENVIIPKIVMGPIPDGGICIELHANEQNAMYVTVSNDGSIEIDIKYYDYYSTIYEYRNIYQLITQYELLTER